MPRTQQVIKVRTSIKNGEIIIPHQKFQNCEIPECITYAKNGEALTTILNNCEQKVTLNFSEPLPVEKFDNEYLEEISCNKFEHSQKRNFDYSKLRIEHLNPEEKSQILKLCTEFSDIFYDENEPLTFTSKIKH